MRRDTRLLMTGQRALFFLIVLSATIALPSVVEAQQARRFEISPFVGWRQGGALADDPTGLEVDLSNGTAYGFMVDVSVTPNLQVEFVWSHTKSDVEIGLTPGNDLPDVRFPLMSAYVDHVQGGLLYQWNLANPNIKPFIVGTVGATVFTPEFEDLDTASNFSWSAGGGMKFFFSRHFGFRAEYRLFSTRTNFVDNGVWCDPFGFCYYLSAKQNLWQSQFAGALIVAF